MENFVSVWMRILNIEEIVQGWSAHSDSFCCPATTSPARMIPWPRIRARCHKPLVTCGEGASANDHRARTHEHADLHSDGCNSQERKAQPKTDQALSAVGSELQNQVAGRLPGIASICEFSVPSWNSRWRATSADFRSSSATTREILDSDAPCALAMILMFSRPSAPIFAGSPTTSRDRGPARRTHAR